ncbi:hypothetical protein ACSBR1_018493 [Camellia fascicularis]
MVDIGKPSCSCRLWEIDSFPCKYGFCAIKRIPSMWKPNVVADDDVVLPPLCKRPPRTERIPSKGETKRIRCSRCEKMGTHNRKTCKEALL